MFSSKTWNTDMVATWAGGVLQVTQVWLFGDAVNKLAWLAVLVASWQLQCGQLLHRVFIQHQAFVHHHRRRKTVLWRREEGERRKEREIFMNKTMLAFSKFMETIHPHRLRLRKEEGEKIKRAEGYIRKKLRNNATTSTKLVGIMFCDCKGRSMAHQELWKSDIGQKDLDKRIRKDWEERREVIRGQCSRKRYEWRALL